jgi:hypothetical protein
MLQYSRGKGGNRMKKKATLVIAAAIIIATASSSLASVRFSDENNVPWEGAKTYIAEVADLGLMVGEDNGDGTNLFRARDKVTYFETIQLAYNILLKEKKAIKSKAVTEKWATVLMGYDVPLWAYESTAYALENKLVSISELSGYVDKNNNSVYATREGVAVIFGKALSKVYDTGSGSSVTFNDDNLISDDAKKYVNLLSKLNILVGDNNANFNPSAYINRAEMAVVVFKTYSVINGGADSVATSTFEGTVTETEIDGDNKSLKVKDSNGNIKTFKGGSSTATTYNGSSADFMDITAGDKVNITYDDDTIIRVSMLNSNSAQSSAREVKGTINNISSSNIVVDLSSGTTDIYNFNSNVVITFNGKLSSVREVLRSIENGNTLNVTVGLKSGMADSVVVKGDKDTVRGTLTDIDKYGISVKCYNSYEKDFDLAYNYEMKFEGESAKYSDLSDYLDKYDEIEIKAKLNDSVEVTELDADIPTDGGSVSGSSKKISDEKVSLAFPDGTSKAYQLEGTPYVIYQDDVSSLGKLESLVDRGDTLSLKIYLNSKGKVTKIEAELDDDTAGVISKLTDDYITITTESGKTIKYYMRSDVDIDYTDDSSDDDLSTLEDMYIPDKTEVKLELSGDEVKRIIIYDDSDYNSYSGTLENITSSDFEVDGKDISYGSSAEITIDGESAAAYDFYRRAANGEVFKAVVKTKADKAIIISAELKSVKGTVSNIQNNKISVIGNNYESTYDLIDEDNSDKKLVIRINGNDRDYTIKDFYSGWYYDGCDYKLELRFYEGKVYRIYAEY